ncbi:hypothetical protein [Priestia megaterium]
MDVLFFFIDRETRLTRVSKNSPLSLLNAFLDTEYMDIVRSA